MSGLQIQTTQNTPRNPSSKSLSNPHRFGDIKANVQQTPKKEEETSPI